MELSEAADSVGLPVSRDGRNITGIRRLLVGDIFSVQAAEIFHN